MAPLPNIVFLLLLLATFVASQGIVFPGATESPSGECTVAPSRGRGWCRLLKNCPPMQAQILKGIEPKHCGTKNGEPVVCCPVTIDRIVDDPTNPITLKTIPPPTALPECGRRGTPPSLPTPSASESRRRRGATIRKASPLLDDLSGLHKIRTRGVSQALVAGGRDAVRNAWPWMALLGQRVGRLERDDQVKWYCDGTLLNNRWVLTAAHCLDIGNPHVIRLGDHNKNSESDLAEHVNFSVNKSVLYPDYRRRGSLASYHDLALIELSNDVVFKENVSPICLPWGEAALHSLHNETVTITGWGATKFGGNHTDVLQEAKVTVFPSKTCDEAYQDLPAYTQKWPLGITEETFMCAGKPEGGVDACQGDSGGPLAHQDPTTRRFMLRGVVSQGYGCGLKAFPGLYVPLAEQRYLAWIKEVAFSDS